LIIVAAVCKEGRVRSLVSVFLLLGDNRRL
jgi:hypothetical protein